ncbi:uncharacterized protein LOC126984034 [Eriocheir sinensis]|uniref:uncharacterized protein LOC126984034 n=1 Tax=Eriocheir sinensis TaxID=95602 RepID=UPI0021C8AE8E|nr:uncharacterized protein LOC126984034 [Eriocheir sinensis]XP_050693353.1 uncharacterized protein LOC126984034 [Eriocheir sinensis]
MPSAAVSAAASATQHLNHSLRSLGFDLTNIFGNFDLHTVSLLGLLLLAAVLLLDVFSKGSNRPSYFPNTTTYGSYGRNGLASSGSSHLESTARTSRGLETMTQVLESLTNAAKRYEGQDAAEEQPVAKEQHLK